jgi:hypothetical protein
MMVPAARRAACGGVAPAHDAALRTAPKGIAPSEVVVKGMGLGLQADGESHARHDFELLHGQNGGSCRTVDSGSDGLGCSSVVPRATDARRDPVSGCRGSLELDRALRVRVRTNIRVVGAGDADPPVLAWRQPVPAQRPRRRRCCAAAESRGAIATPSLAVP